MPYRGHQVLGGQVLEQKTGGARFDRAIHVFIEIECRQDQDPGPPTRRDDLLRSLNAVEIRHSNVHQENVGLLAERKLNCAFAIRSFADHLHVRLSFDYPSQARPDQLLVVSDCDPERH
jgi:hypothetical protein